MALSYKDMVVDWITAMVQGDVATFQSYFAEDCRFLVAGDMPFCGWMDSKGFFSQATILPLAAPITLEIASMTIEEGRVWFEAQSRSTLKGGKPYNNYYVFFVRFDGDKIVEYKEFADTYYVYRTIDAPQTRGEPQLRYPIFDTPGLTVSGSGTGESIKARQRAGASVATENAPRPHGNG